MIEAQGAHYEMLRRLLSMNYLLIDTSNQPLSVALMQDEKVLIEQTTNIKQNHSVQLMPEIQSYLNSLKLINKKSQT